MFVMEARRNMGRLNWVWEIEKSVNRAKIGFYIDWLLWRSMRSMRVTMYCGGRVASLVFWVSRRK